MVFQVINNPSFQAKTGFTQGQFKKLDDLYCRAASIKTLNFRTVECDFDEGVASYTYYKVQSQPPMFRFVIRRVGPRDMMYEVYKQGSGCIVKSGIFSKAYDRLAEEIRALVP